jgi:hypothetical protein
MASFCVEAFGCERLSRLTYDDINARFREFKQLVHFEETEFQRPESAAIGFTPAD